MSKSTALTDDDDYEHSDDAPPPPLLGFSQLQKLGQQLFALAKHNGAETTDLRQVNRAGSCVEQQLSSLSLMSFIILTIVNDVLISIAPSRKGQRGSFFLLSIVSVNTLL